MFWCWTFFRVQLSHRYVILEKPQLWLCCWQNAVSTFYYRILFVIFFLPRSKGLLIAWLQSMTTMIFNSKKVKSAIVSTFYPSICHEVMGPDTMTLLFRILSSKPVFSLSSFIFIKRLFGSSLLSAIRVVSSACLRLVIFLLAILIPVCD